MCYGKVLLFLVSQNLYYRISKSLFAFFWLLNVFINILLTMSGDTLLVTELANKMNNLLKTNFLSKPSVFSSSSSTIKDHLSSVEKYCKCVSATTDLEKVLILWESIDSDTQKEIIFDSEYDSNNENFEWISNKLKVMFPIKSTKASDLMNLNQIRQNGRTIADFVSHIKQECATRKCNFATDELQSIAVKIFISGLENELFRRTLKQLMPKNIDEAYAAIKNVKEGKDCVRQMQSKENGCTQCTSHIKELANKIDYLHKIITTLQRSVMEITSKPFSREQYPRRQANAPPPRNNRPPIRCYNCNKIGHLQKFCRNQRRNFRQLSYDDNNSNRTFFSQQDNQSTQSIPETDNYDNSCNLIQYNEEKDYTNPARTAKKYNRCSMHTSRYDDEIYSLEKYINGQSPIKTVAMPMTVITTRNSETARNKPIINGLVNGKQSKVFLDSGANVNVIDETFLIKQVGIISSEIKPHVSAISCANGSQLGVTGTCNLSVTLGNSTKLVPFLVVKKMFPPVILGIVGMKQLSASICPKRSCAFIDHLRVPFLSTVDSVTKNGRELYPRTAIKLRI